MPKSRFKITPFRNPSGDKVWRVSGTLNGERIRKNFKSRPEAVAHRQKLDIRHLNETAQGRTIWTTLTQEQNQDAIAAVNLLRSADSKRSLTFATRYFLEHYKEAKDQVSVEDAVEAYVEEKEKDLRRSSISSRQLREIRLEMNRFRSGFADRFVHEITVDEIKAYLDQSLSKGARPSLKTWNNRRGYLSTFFKFCLIQGFVAADPILSVQQHKIKHARGTAETLSATKAAELMHWLETYRGKQNKDGSWWGQPGCMIPYFALTLFAGIRPDWKDGEIGKLRPQDIRLDTNVILIEPFVSKTNEKRIIKIQPNLRIWLEHYPLEQFPIMPKRRFRAMLMDIRKTHNLGHDVMRHTFISMTVAAFRSVGDASLQAGNSEAIIRRHYLDLKSTEEVLGPHTLAQFL